jgi:hypothetical protein
MIAEELRDSGSQRGCEQTLKRAKELPPPPQHAADGMRAAWHGTRQQTEAQGHAAALCPTRSCSASRIQQNLSFQRATFSTMIKRN